MALGTRTSCVSCDLKEAVKFEGKWNFILINEFMGTIILFKCLYG